MKITITEHRKNYDGGAILEFLHSNLGWPGFRKTFLVLKNFNFFFVRSFFGLILFVAINRIVWLAGMLWTRSGRGF